MKKLHKKTLEALRKTNGNKSQAESLLGVSRHVIGRRCKQIEKQYTKAEIEKHCPVFFHPSRELTEEDLIYTWSVYESCNYNKSRTAEALQLSIGAIQSRVRKCRAVLNVMEEEKGSIRAKTPKIAPLPKKGKIKRYIFTSAQNNTHVHEPIWESLLALAEHYEAEIKIATFTYVKNQQGSQKRSAVRHRAEDIWYDTLIEPYVSDTHEVIAPGLVWCGEMNTLPTAKNPLSGWETYTGISSGIFPHPKLQMQSVPTHKQDVTKFNYTTGAITKRNYIHKRAGILAEFHHSYGGLLVEVDSEGNWFARQLNSDTKGHIYDLDVVAKPDGSVQKYGQAEAIVWGDIHVACLEPMVKSLGWTNKDSMIDVLKPKNQFMHDVLDFESRSHHNRRNPHEMYRIHVQGVGSVLDEIKDVGRFLHESQRDFCQTYVVNSNHDNHLDQWLRETEWRDDMLNAEFYIDAQRELLRCIREGDSVNMLEWAIGANMDAPDAVFLHQDESKVICHDNSGGIEMGMHGDMGPNGARGSFRNLAKIGRKACIGHSHSAGIYEGIYVAGVSGTLEMGYNSGPGSWSHSHIVVYPNGKRSIITMGNNKWRA
jgi:hypothetical protein